MGQKTITGLNGWLYGSLAIAGFMLFTGLGGLVKFGPNTLVNVVMCTPEWCYTAFPVSLIIFSGFMLLIAWRSPQISFFVLMFTIPLFELIPYAFLFTALTPKLVLLAWVLGLIGSSAVLWKKGYGPKATWLLPAYILTQAVFMFHGWTPPVPQPDVPLETFFELFLLVVVWRTWNLGRLFR